MIEHPYAQRFPSLSEAELDELTESIASSGLHHPIVTIEYEGVIAILDGLNRLAACKAAGVEPDFVRFEDIAKADADPWDYVVEENVLRRHLNTTQRAFLAARSREEYSVGQGRRSTSGSSTKGELWSERAGDAFKVGEKSVRNADQLLKLTGPDSDLPEKKKEKLLEEIAAAENSDGGEKLTVDAIAKKYLRDPAPPKNPAPKSTRNDTLKEILEVVSEIDGADVTKGEVATLKKIGLAITTVVEDSEAV